MNETLSIGEQIVETVVDGVTGLATGVGTAIVDVWNSVMVQNGNLTGVATWGLVFLGIGIVLGFVRKFTRGRG